MKREIMKVTACTLLAGCLAMTTGVTSEAVDTRSETQGIVTITALNEIKESLPEVAAVAVETQEWHGKALANTEKEASIYESADANSKIVGKMYRNTILNVEEKGETWSKVSSGEVVGYIQNEQLSFGTAAVERAKSVCPAKAELDGKEYTVVDTDGKQLTLQHKDEEQISVASDAVTVKRDTQDAKTMEQIAAEEAARKAAEEAARKAAEKKAAEEAAKKAAAKTSPAVSASTSDRELLAAIIYCEAGGEPYEGKVAVGAVIMNRVRSGRFPNTIRDVIYQRGQFGPAMTGKLGRVLAAGKTSSECYRAADAALAGSNPIGNALFFGNGNSGQKIGGHYFH